MELTLLTGTAVNRANNKTLMELQGPAMVSSKLHKGIPLLVNSTDRLEYFVSQQLNHI